MNKAVLVSTVATAVLLFGVPVHAADIAGAGSGSNGGVVSGATNESSGMMKTGTTGGTQPSTNTGAPLPANANPDNAVLNAPREPAPGTTGASQPSNLNGQSK